MRGRSSAGAAACPRPRAVLVSCSPARMDARAYETPAHRRAFRRFGRSRGCRRRRRARRWWQGPRARRNRCRSGSSSSQTSSTMSRESTLRDSKVDSPVTSAGSMSSFSFRMSLMVSMVAMAVLSSVARSAFRPHADGAPAIRAPASAQALVDIGILVHLGGGVRRAAPPA